MQACHVTAKIVLLHFQDDVQSATAAVTSLLVHKSIAFVHMY